MLSISVLSGTTLPSINAEGNVVEEEVMPTLQACTAVALRLLRRKQRESCSTHSERLGPTKLRNSEFGPVSNILLHQSLCYHFLNFSLPASLK